MKIDGACHCGKIAYEAEIDPDTVLICHCTDCQTLSGSAFRTIVPARQENFRLLTGAPKTYIKTADNGAARAQTFCPECGSPLYATSVGDGPKIFNIRLGTARQRGVLTPRKQVWSRSARDWVTGIGTVERIETQ